MLVARTFPLRRLLILVLVLPALVVLLGISFFADRALRRALDNSLGKNLIAIAQSAATIIDPKIALLEKGDDELRMTRRTRQKLKAFMAASNVQRILILNRRTFSVLVDSEQILLVGDDYSRSRFDQHELDKSSRGTSIASVLFRGTEGRWYKSAYSPLGDDALIVVHAPAEFFSVIDQLRTWLLGSVIAGSLILILLAFISARRVTIPLSRLTEAAEEIGKGRLKTSVPTTGPFETQVLGKTMAQMARSLYQRDEEWQMMIGGIAHEVRNPLGGIELFASLLKEDLEGDEEKQRHVEKILKEIKVLSSVVNDFLFFSRKQELSLAQVDLKELLLDVCNMASKEAADKDVVIDVETEEKITVKLDQQVMHAALLNLLRNAIQASPENESVTLKAGVQGQALTIEILDHGEGIAADKLDHIFTPFFTTKQKGTGLGLALAQKAVRAHCGELNYEARKPRGARFVVRLPIKVPAPQKITEAGLVDPS